MQRCKVATGAAPPSPPPPPHPQACLYHRTYIYFLVPFTPRVQPAQTDQLHVAPARLLREAPGVGAAGGGVQTRPGTRSHSQLAEGGRACNREGSEPRGVVPVAGRGSWLWADPPQGLLVR